MNVMRKGTVARLLGVALVTCAASGCGVLDWLGKHPPPNNPPPVPPPVKSAYCESVPTISG